MKTAEDFWNEHCFITDEGYCINKEDFLAYASQFQSPERVSEPLKTFSVRLRAYINKKLTEAGLRVPDEFWETINVDEALEYLHLSTPSDQEAIAFWEWAYDNGYRYMSDGQSLDAEGKTVFSNEIYQLFKSAK